MTFLHYRGRRKCLNKALTLTLDQMFDKEEVKTVGRE